MSFGPYGQKVTGLVSNGIDLICFYINRKRRREKDRIIDVENNLLEAKLA